jgi:hypothetical protein
VRATKRLLTWWVECPVVLERSAVCFQEDCYRYWESRYELRALPASRKRICRPFGLSDSQGIPKVGSTLSAADLIIIVLY